MANSSAPFCADSPTPGHHERPDPDHPQSPAGFSSENGYFGPAWFIPELAAKELEAMASRIAICRRDIEGTLRRVGPHDPSEAFTFVSELQGAISGLQPLAEITTFHRTGHPIFFKPSAKEVFAQIPPDLRDRVAAFETIPMDDHVEVAYSAEAGMHQAVTVLYTAPSGLVETPVSEAAIRGRRIAECSRYHCPSAAEVDPRFSTTERIVLCGDGDRSACWKLLAHNRSISWIQQREGAGFVLGYHKDHPIGVTAFWDTVAGEHVAFMEITSSVSDMSRLKSWIETHLRQTPVEAAAQYLSRCGGSEHYLPLLNQPLALVEKPDVARETFKGVSFFIEAGAVAREEIAETVVCSGRAVTRSSSRTIVELQDCDGDPLRVEFETVRIGARSVAFYGPTDGPFDLALVRAWLDRSFPSSAEEGRANRTDAGNFHLCLDALERQEKR